ncbi:hypothetical protein [Actinomadura macra]|uniref:hypothetical protein n=1 Tax=Actinomadura macra TaxID=46164 RepID=UPI00083306FC|nr:hypothetical protein [Actinomadura macra]
MGEASLTGCRVRRMIRLRYLKWRTEWHRETVLGHLDTLALALERQGWRCVKTYHPDLIPVRVPLLRVYGAEIATTLCVMAMPDGRWGFHEAARGRAGLLCHCGDVAQAVQVVDRLLRDRSR